ncbi:MAG: hypothetical protein ACK47B_16715 [Armatimonadota bacterium]
MEGSSKKTHWHPWLALGLVPALLYLGLFCAFTYPLIERFSTHLFCDTGDGLQNVWNIWWVNKAVTELGTHPWFTREVQFPHGTTLIGQTLNPFNGFVCVGLLPFLSLTQAHNAMVVFSFMMGGLTAFWLAHHVTKSYPGSLVGGAVYTFSSYHFAHAQGHLQLVSLEWIPLFLLSWLVLLHRPSVRAGLFAAGALFLVILCDYYYFFCSVVAAVLILAYYGLRARKLSWKQILWNDLLRINPFSRQALETETFRSIVRRWPEFRARYLAPLAAFAVAALCSSGVLAITLLATGARDPFFPPGHPPDLFSLDLPAVLIPGGHWRFAEWTRWYWSRLPGVIHESSVHLGVSVLALTAIAWACRRRAGARDLGLWLTVLLVFFVLALGPYLRVGGSPLGYVKLPYAWMTDLFPPLTLGGMPVRLIVMVTLAAGVLAAAGIGVLARAGTAGRLAAAAFVLLWAFEIAPSERPASRLETPRYVTLLQEQPGREAVFDLVSGLSEGLYWQTVYDRPQAFGYISRWPRSVKVKNNQIRRLEHRAQWELLYPRFGIRYLIAPAGTAADRRHSGIRRMYADHNAELYDLLGTRDVKEPVKPWAPPPPAPAIRNGPAGTARHPQPVLRPGSVR